MAGDLIWFEESDLGISLFISCLNQDKYLKTCTRSRYQSCQPVSSAALLCRFTLSLMWSRIFLLSLLTEGFLCSHLQMSQLAQRGIIKDSMLARQLWSSSGGIGYLTFPYLHICGFGMCASKLCAYSNSDLNLCMILMESFFVSSLVPSLFRVYICTAPGATRLKHK